MIVLKSSWYSRFILPGSASLRKLPSSGWIRGQRKTVMHLRGNAQQSKYRHHLEKILAVSCLSVCASGCFYFSILHNRQLKNSFKQPLSEYFPDVVSKMLTQTFTFPKRFFHKLVKQDTLDDKVESVSPSYPPSDESQNGKVCATIHRDATRIISQDAASLDASFDKLRDFKAPQSRIDYPVKNADTPCLGVKESMSDEKELFEEKYRIEVEGVKGEEVETRSKNIKSDALETNTLENLDETHVNSSFINRKGTLPQASCDNLENGPCQGCPASIYAIDALRQAFFELRSLRQLLSKHRCDTSEESSASLMSLKKTSGFSDIQVYLNHYEDFIVERLKSIETMVIDDKEKINNQMKTMDVLVEQFGNQLETLEGDMRKFMNLNSHIQFLLDLQKRIYHQPMCTAELVCILAKEFKEDAFIRTVLSYVPNHLFSPRQPKSLSSYEGVQKEFLKIQRNALQCLFLSSRRGLIDHLCAGLRRWFYEKTSVVLPDRLLWNTCMESRGVTLKNLRIFKESCRAVRCGDTTEAFEKLLLLKGEFRHLFQAWLVEMEDRLTLQGLLDVVIIHLRSQQHHWPDK